VRPLQVLQRVRSNGAVDFPTGPTYGSRHRQSATYGTRVLSAIMRSGIETWAKVAADGGKRLVSILRVLLRGPAPYRVTPVSMNVPARHIKILNW
jgi:hypothetical protein